MAFTTIDDSSVYFQTKLYTGNGGTNAITNTGNSDLQPNWIWFKCRSAAEHHGFFDSVRGVTKVIYSNLNNAEDTVSDSLASFNSDGFTMGADSGSGGAFNGDTKTMAAWQWKAGTAFTNDASSTSVGSIDSAGSVNTDAGFSIISYTGTGSVGTIAHGLGVVPSMYILKRRAGDTENWPIYHQSVGNTHALYLNTTDTIYDYANFTNDTSPTSSVFSVGGSNNQANPDGSTMIAYCFAEKQGYSKMGSYTGTANADGAFVYTGFKPRWIMIKGTNIARNWGINDTKRSPINQTQDSLYANVADAETGSGNYIDFLSNGFKLRDTALTMNGAYKYIYMAFAENPFVTSTGVPATAK